MDKYFTRAFFNVGDGISEVSLLNSALYENTIIDRYLHSHFSTYELSNGINILYKKKLQNTWQNTDT